MNKVLLGLVAILVLTGCEPSVQRSDPKVPLVVEGCDIARYEVVPGSGSGTEVVYIARCKAQETTSVSTKYRCGKNCTKKVTTITTIEGMPDSGASEIPTEQKQ